MLSLTHQKQQAGVAVSVRCSCCAGAVPRTLVVITTTAAAAVIANVGVVLARVEPSWASCMRHTHACTHARKHQRSPCAFNATRHNAHTAPRRARSHRRHRTLRQTTFLWYPPSGSVLLNKLAGKTRMSMLTWHAYIQLKKKRFGECACCPRSRRQTRAMLRARLEPDQQPANQTESSKRTHPRSAGVVCHRVVTTTVPPKP